jgi:hypothetical protein
LHGYSKSQMYNIFFSYEKNPKITLLKHIISHVDLIKYCYIRQFPFLCNRICLSKFYYNIVRNVISIYWKNFFVDIYILMNYIIGNYICKNLYFITPFHFFSILFTIFSIYINNIFPSMVFNEKIRSVNIIIYSISKNKNY